MLKFEEGGGRTDETRDFTSNTGCSCTAFTPCLYLQTRDWILLQSMSLNPINYERTLAVHGYEPVPTLDPMAPEELLKFTSCNVMEIAGTGGAAARRTGSRACRHVESVKALHAEIAVMMVLNLQKIWTMTVEPSEIVNQN